MDAAGQTHQSDPVIIQGGPCGKLYCPGHEYILEEVREMWRVPDSDQWEKVKAVTTRCTRCKQRVDGILCPACGNLLCWERLYDEIFEEYADLTRATEPVSGYRCENGHYVVEDRELCLSLDEGLEAARLRKGQPICGYIAPMRLKPLSPSVSAQRTVSTPEIRNTPNAVALRIVPSVVPSPTLETEKLTCHFHGSLHGREELRRFVVSENCLSAFGPVEDVWEGASIYVCLRDNRGNIVALARLIKPSLHGFPIERYCQLFSGFVHDSLKQLRGVKREELVEVDRVGVKQTLDEGQRRQALRILFQEIIRWSRQEGIKRWYAMVPPPALRLWREILKFPSTPIGSVVRWSGLSRQVCG